MAQTPPSIMRNAMTTGALLGLALIVFAIVIYFIDFSKMSANAMSLILLIQTVILIAGIIYSTRIFRDKHLNGVISYRNAVIVGTATVFFAGIIVSFYNYIFNVAIDPSYAEKLAKVVSNNYAIMLQNLGYTAAQIEEQVKNLNPKDAPPSFDLAIFDVFSTALYGFILSLITSAILKRNNPRLLNKNTESPQQI